MPAGSGGNQQSTGGAAGSVPPGSGGGAVSTGGSAGSATGGAAGGRVGTGGSSSGGSGAGGVAGGAGGPPIVDLFNGTDLTGWTVYQQVERSQTQVGTVLTGANATRIFKPENREIRVYGDDTATTTQERCTMVTDKSYSKYNFFMEYRWGTKRFPPYATTIRDAGILFHIHGQKAMVWPYSIEFQIKEGTVGDIYTILASCKSYAQTPSGMMFMDPANGGVPTNVIGGTGSGNYIQHLRSVNAEIAGWNSLEMRVDGPTAIYVVNGRIVNRVTAIATRGGVAVTSGPIALQAEHAEVFYRNIRIQELP